ncbi:UDP-N-acetylglucosamine 2-epimerase [Pseudodesulfovibrio sp. zrk46]|uniref:UDP-N-acetylglucosamine 2-epimerase n=1 Tax=Pseudodesulfovibrio sp. zrk46 TaxID=2725288 RepID=UPI001449CA2B|nr:UDP-N-acetylglucosamine 2-epimerase [Pseudodesulfovibrio sp. zrk46]QJB56575.1 UDP-N-acetylglucosamine 2-epimerase (hydrolyzing) [Pseudodesulfovibrio sp. zrk46]
MKKICVFTGTRAEYGLLRGVLEKLRDASEVELAILASGSHLSPEFGNTFTEIENDGFVIDEKVEMLLSSDSEVGMVKSMGLGLIGYGDAFARLKPDMLVVLGDRFEAFSVCAAALAMRLPVAHIHGGEVTEGAIDEGIRHSITKMSQLHFCTTEEHRRRIIQLGEDPVTVFNVGSPGVENIKKVPLMSKSELAESIGFDLSEPYLVATYHPVTLSSATLPEFNNFLSVMAETGCRLVFTKANADAEGRFINERIDEFAAENPELRFSTESLGLVRYLSAMKYSAGVVGNSSSGIIEAPSLGVPTVNIGDRQKGRVRAESVIDCGTDADSIRAALERALSPEFSSFAKQIKNPYEGDAPSSTIVEQLLRFNGGVMKRFYDLPCDVKQGD